jgi:hypothetical protein
MTFWQHLIRQHGLHGYVRFITVYIARLCSGCHGLNGELPSRECCHAVTSSFVAFARQGADKPEFSLRMLPSNFRRQPSVLLIERLVDSRDAAALLQIHLKTLQLLAHKGDGEAICEVVSGKRGAGIFCSAPATIGGGADAGGEGAGGAATGGAGYSFKQRIVGTRSAQALGGRKADRHPEHPAAVHAGLQPV